MAVPGRGLLAGILLGFARWGGLPTELGAKLFVLRTEMAGTPSCSCSTESAAHPRALELSFVPYWADLSGMRTSPHALSEYDTPLRHFLKPSNSICYDVSMSISLRLRFGSVALLLLGYACAAQNSKGALDLTARITPTGARPEPVRQFTFYVLSKSFAEITAEVEQQDKLPSRDEFIERLKVSKPLKDWLKAHDVMDLTQPDLDKLVTPDEIIAIPEFLAAYQRSNSGGVTAGLPTPKFRESDKETNPEKYEKLQQDYMVSMKKFMEAHPSTISGMELELGAVNPKLAWDKLQIDHKKKVAQLSPDIAQSRYLAAQADTDLEGHAFINGLAPGNYWVSTLGMDAASGDRHLLWDVPTSVEASRTTRLNLTNVNATDVNASPR
jgi:hypothetical protein